MRSQRQAESRNGAFEDSDKTAGFYFKWNKKSLVIFNTGCDVLWLKKVTLAVVWRVG